MANDGPRRDHTRALIGLMVVVVIIAVALSIGTYRLAVTVDHHQHQDIARVELAVQAARRAEYRICNRVTITRAFLNRDDELEHLHDLPLYDCTPNLYGQVARRLTPREARALERHLAQTAASQIP